jgi:hypothetical protein
MPKLTHENRKQKRFLKRCLIEFAADGQTYRGIVRNLCLDGLFIKTRKPLPPDRIVSIILELPDGSISKLAGRVTRAIREPYSLVLERAGIPSKDGMGVELIEKDTYCIEFIRSLTGLESAG